jgi:hypothetical protein
MDYLKSVFVVNIGFNVKKNGFDAVEMFQIPAITFSLLPGYSRVNCFLTCLNSS